MAGMLEIRNLSIEFSSPKGIARAVNNVSLSIDRGESLGIVGESGSGKSTIAHAVMQLLPKTARISSGSVFFEGRDLLKMSAADLRSVRGRDISMIFQDPMQCLDPSFTIAYQLIETIQAHEKLSKDEARKASLKMLQRVGIHNAEDIMQRYQHELSGGMRQRVMIAMALLTRPRLLIADEPTTALDVTIQDQILQLLKGYAKEAGMSMLFITHSFGVVADICDRVAVLYGGRLCECGSSRELFYEPRHPYTKGLLDAVPTMERDKDLPLSSIDGAPVSVFDPPKGCPFAPRCVYCRENLQNGSSALAEKCLNSIPELNEASEGHSFACFLEQ
ncbi:MAG: ABC transporter ATP-binding protein [Firmicutes bacterium]|nr:ABC transporter ATP-binding protein [Bacillota bacterium]